jgi:hypothetical protein
MAARKRASGGAIAKPAVAATADKPKRRARKKADPVAAQPAEAAPYPLLTPSGEPVNIVHLAAELAPFARTGGLGEAVANLALYQVRSGIRTSIIMPMYRQVHDVVQDFVPAGDPFTVTVGPRQEYAQLFESASLRARQGEGKPRVYFIDNKKYFDREGIYGDKYGDYGDNARRWSFFALAALTALPQVTEAPVMMHAHDWHAALAPAYCACCASSSMRSSSHWLAPCSSRSVFSPPLRQVKRHTSCTYSHGCVSSSSSRRGAISSQRACVIRRPHAVGTNSTRGGRPRPSCETRSVIWESC